MAAALSTTTWLATIQAGAPISHVTTGVAQMTIIAARLVARSMLPSRCQLLINGPKVPCSRSQLSSRFEERAKAKAATNRNGVVGKSGSTTPIAPRATEARPSNNQMNRVSSFTL